MKLKLFILSSLFGLVFFVSSCAINDSNINNSEDVTNVKKEKMKAVFSSSFKDTYLLGESLTYDGLKMIDARFSRTLTDYTIYPEEGTALDELGETTITVSKSGYEDYKFTVDVVNELPEEDDEPSYKVINLYSINDFHGSFIENSENGEIGMSKLSSYLIERKEEGGIILSAGDMWQGGVESNLTKGKIIVDSMNHIGFDAMTIGNHEFDWGFEVLEDNINDMDFPMLGANCFDNRTNQNFSFLKPYTIIEQDEVKIGVIGTGAETLPSDITYNVSQYLEFKDQVQTVKYYSDYLKNDEKCDLVILLAHDGGSFDYGEAPYYLEDLTEISENSRESYIDAMFLGHDHDTKSGTLNSIPYAEGGSNGKGVSHISLALEKKDDDYDVAFSSSNVIKTFYSGLFNKDDAYIDSLLEKYADELEAANKVICTFETSLSKNDILDILCEALISYANDPKHESILIDDKLVNAAFHNNGGVRSTIDAGEFTYRDLIKVVPFDNTMCIVKLSESQYETWKNNGDHYIEKTYNSPFIYVATINYLADNVVYYPNSSYFNTNVVIQDVLTEYLQENY